MIKTSKQKTDFDWLIEYNNSGSLSSFIMNSSDLAIKVKTLDGTIVLWNCGAEKIYGYTKEEMIGKNIKLIIPLKNVNELKIINETCEKGNTIHNLETERITKSGELIHVALSFFPIKNEGGKVVGIASIDKDLTETVKTNRELIYQTNEKNKRAAELVIADKELVYQVKEKANKVAELVIADKELLYQKNKKGKIEIENKKLEVLSNSLKLASQYARSLIEASKDPLVTISAAGKITDVNNASITVTGISRENLIGTDFSIYFTEPQKAREVYKMVFEKSTVTDFPLTIKHKNGKLIDVLYNASVYKNESGEVLGVCATARDVTFQKSITKELNEAKLFAERATFVAEEAKRKAESATILAQDSVKAKQQFLSNMSHEIRTPMNAIIGFTKVILKTELSPKQREYLTAIKMSGDALIVLINDILDLAKVDAGKMTFEKIPFKVSVSIAAMLHLFDSKIQEKNLKLITEYDPNIPEVLIGDPIRLHQIILNLVSNAVKFTNHGSISVCTKLINNNDNYVTIEFSVKDTGIGIAANKLDKIFENFQQASSGTSRLYGGTGLGLAIVKQLVEPQGGKIKVESKLGEGSTFSFSLDFSKTIEKPEAHIELTNLNNEIKNISVLVVEDIALNQLLMKTLLEDFGFGCDIASNGKIAVENIESNVYDIVLMDLQMPEMNGFEATRHIRNTLNSNIPIVALTADVTTVDLAKCKAVGMDDYIAKPVDEKLLYSKIIELVNKKNVQIKNSESILNKKYQYIDLAYLNRCTKSNAKLMMELISLYLEQTNTLIEALKRGYKNKDWHLLQATAHKLIPSLIIIGVNKNFEDMAKKLQQLAKDENHFVLIKK
jgi:PAS domain S-box-containing protein